MRALKTTFACLSAMLFLANCSTASEATRMSRNAPAPEVSRAGSSDLACLAEAIYFEAGGAGTQGEAAVAHVVVNRSESGEFPRSVCGVVADGCQFSYKCDGRSDALANASLRAQALRTAQAVLSGAPDITNGALFFHSAQASPGWFNTRPRVGNIGGNIFYR